MSRCATHRCMRGRLRRRPDRPERPVRRSRAPSGPSRTLTPEIGGRRSPPGGVLDPRNTRGIPSDLRPCLAAPATGLSSATSREDPLVDRRVRRHRREQGVLAALAAQHRRPQALGVLAEDLLPARRLDDPGLLLELALELARTPPGVAGEHAGAAHAARDLIEVGRGAADEPEVVVEQDAGERGLVELRQHDHGAQGARPADVDRRARVGELREVRNGVGDQRLGGPVEHEAHGALFRVLGDQQDGAVEVGVDEDGRGDQQLAAHGLHDPHIVTVRRRMLGVLAFGDSITNGGGELQWGVALQSWALWTARALGLPYTPYATDGGSLRTVLDEQIPAFSARAEAPDGPYDVGCLYIGTNDVRGFDWDPFGYERDLGEALGFLAARCGRTLTATIPLDLGRPRAGAKVRDANAIIERRAREAGTLVVDLTGFRGRRVLMADHVHPTAFGQIAIAERALDVLERDGLPARTRASDLMRYETSRWGRLRGDATYAYRHAKVSAEAGANLANLRLARRRAPGL